MKQQQQQQNPQQHKLISNELQKFRSIVSNKASYEYIQPKNPALIQGKQLGENPYDNLMTKINNHQKQAFNQTIYNKEKIDEYQFKTNRSVLSNGKQKDVKQRVLQDKFKKFDNLQIGDEDAKDRSFEIRVFPNSTKGKLEQPSFILPSEKKTLNINKPQLQTQQKSQQNIAHNYQIVAPISKSGTPIMVDLDLEQKLFPPKKNSTRDVFHQIESTVLVDTDRIKSEFMTPRANRSFEGYVTIKLHRQPDPYFYKFIQEYGMIIQPNSPSDVNTSSTYGHQFSDLGYQSSNYPTKELFAGSGNSSPRDQENSLFFSKYFQNTEKSSQQNRYKRYQS